MRMETVASGAYRYDEIRAGLLARLLRKIQLSQRNGMASEEYN